MAQMKVAIVGAGSIGAGWTIFFASAGHRVALYDPEIAQRESAKIRIGERLTLLKSHALLGDTVDQVLDRIEIFNELATAVSGAILIQECGPERVDIKREIFHEIESHADRGAIIASSSSTIKPSEFTNEMKHPERSLVIHPGNPPYLILVGEIVPTSRTSESVITQSRQILESCGMRAVLVRNEPQGFVFNRLQGAILREAYCLVRDGVISARELDEIMIKGLGKRWALIGAFGVSALNVKGGIRAHAARMGESYHQMGLERGQNDPWTPDLVEEVASDIEKKFPVEKWEADVLERDEALMKLTRLMKELGR
jgi:3-hydroxyacyl-CoA dehydrogenase